MVLVDDADILTVREPEEAKVFGFLEVAVQVVKNLTPTEGEREDCVGYRMMVGEVPGVRAWGCIRFSPPRKILTIVLTMPNDMECALEYAGQEDGPFCTLTSPSSSEERNDLS